jgi:hypothetical protein
VLLPTVANAFVWLSKKRPVFAPDILLSSHALQLSPKASNFVTKHLLIDQNPSLQYESWRFHTAMGDVFIAVEQFPKASRSLQTAKTAIENTFFFTFIFNDLWFCYFFMPLKHFSNNSVFRNFHPLNRFKDLHNRRFTISINNGKSSFDFRGERLGFGRFRYFSTQ